MTKVTRSFCWHQNFVPWGCYIYIPPGLHKCIKSCKKLYKIRLQRDFFETCNKWVFSDKAFHLTSNFVLWGLSAPCPPAPGLYICIKSWKKMYKIRLQRHFFWNLEQMNEVTRQIFLLTSKLCFPGAVCPPALGLYICIKSWKNCIKTDFKELFLKLATNDRSDKMFLLTSKFCSQGVVSRGYIHV